jgi:hypothetical protein
VEAVIENIPKQEEPVEQPKDIEDADTNTKQGKAKQTQEPVQSF